MTFDDWSAHRARGRTGPPERAKTYNLEFVYFQETEEFYLRVTSRTSRKPIFIFLDRAQLTNLRHVIDETLERMVEDDYRTARLQTETD